jgi:hypothetical protein
MKDLSNISRMSMRAFNLLSNMFEVEFSEQSIAEVMVALERTKHLFETLQGLAICREPIDGPPPILPVVESPKEEPVPPPRKPRAKKEVEEAPIIYDQNNKEHKALLCKILAENHGWDIQGNIEQRAMATVINKDLGARNLDYSDKLAISLLVGELVSEKIQDMDSGKAPF